MTAFNIIGLMSGTSIDGLDVSYCEYTRDDKNRWSFKILNISHFDYPEAIENQLTKASSLSGENLLKLDSDLGHFFAHCIEKFINSEQINRSEIDAIASHGHTIFHQPENGFTAQIGSGTAIAIQTGIKVINDFRSKDVTLGGQGAPLAPTGDLLLFHDKAQHFINIGGFVNISSLEAGVAYDVSPGNLPMNRICNEIGLKYDEHGEIARSGIVIEPILKELTALPYFDQIPPKSLGTEWLDEVFMPILNKIDNNSDKLRTCVELISLSLTKALPENECVMITGGGAHNTFLIERIRELHSGKIIIPNNDLIDYKEAIIFGLLGALRLNNEVNCFSRFTGASKDSSSGIVHIP